MAKLTSPLLSLEAANQLGHAMIFGSRKGKNVARAYTHPRKKKTNAQLQHRIRYNSLVQEWQNLTQARKNAYSEQAQAQGRISGFHQFLHTYLLPEYKGQLYLDTKTRALWHFNQGEGSILYDASEYHIDGAIDGASWTNGKFGKGLSFDGSNRVVMAVPTLFAYPQLTIEAWIKTPSNQANQRIISTGYLYLMWTINRFYCSLTTTSGRTTLASDHGHTLNTWHYVAMTYDGVTHKLLIDSKEQADSKPNTGSVLPHHTAYIGSQSTVYYFIGIIDEIRASSIGKTNQQIIDNWNLAQ